MHILELLSDNCSTCCDMDYGGTGESMNYVVGLIVRQRNK